MGELRQGQVACMKEAGFCGFRNGHRQVLNDVVLSSRAGGRVGSDPDPGGWGGAKSGQ